MDKEDFEKIDNETTIAEMADKGDVAARYMESKLASDMSFRKTVRKFAEKFDRKDPDEYATYQKFASGLGLY